MLTYSQRVTWKAFATLAIFFQGSMNHPPRCKQGIYWMVGKLQNNHQILSFQVNFTIEAGLGFHSD